jgi:ATP-dependent DNA ligase
VIADAATKLRARSFIMDGEVVVVGHDGVAVFEALHRRHMTALWRSNDTHLDLFATGDDGAVWSTSWEAAV